MRLRSGGKITPTAAARNISFELAHHADLPDTLCITRSKKRGCIGLPDKLERQLAIATRVVENILKECRVLKYLAAPLGGVMVLCSVSAQAQSTLDKYLKKSTEGSASVKNQADAAGVNKVYKDPNGFWRLDDTRATGGFCAITYYSSAYYAGYVGPAVGNPDSFILFSGPTIPSIQKETKKKMTLTTGDGEVQTVQAFHAPNTQSKQSGIILFRLTDIQAAMDGISDVENLNVMMDKKQAFAIKWKGGHTARKAMQGCLSGGAGKAAAK
jgi:hypothetical protein